MTKVLVIDDNPVVRNSLIAVLEEAGYQVSAAPDGLVGYTIFHREQPDIVVADIILPEQEGIATIRQMLRENPRAKIIAISGGARVSNVDFLKVARKFGAIDVLAKPFDPDQLLAMLSDCLRAA